MLISVFLFIKIHFQFDHLRLRYNIDNFINSMKVIFIKYFFLIVDNLMNVNLVERILEGKNPQRIRPRKLKRRRSRKHKHNTSIHLFPSKDIIVRHSIKNNLISKIVLKISQIFQRRRLILKFLYPKFQFNDSNDNFSLFRQRMLRV